MEESKGLERLETVLFQRVEQLVMENRYEEAQKVLALMEKAGIV